MHGRFMVLVEQWQRETGMLSLVQKIVIYLAYQRQRELLRTMLPNATLGQTGINSL